MSAAKFTEAEIFRLKTFCDVCERIAACRFIRDLPKQSHHIFVGTLPDGTIMDEYPRYDDEDFRAFLTHYRKLRSDKEPAFLFRIINLLKKNGTQVDKDFFNHMKHEVQEEERGWWSAIIKEEDGSKTLLTQREVENVIFNGDVFHDDHAKQRTLRQLREKSSLVKLIAFVNYLRLARAVVFCAQKTAEFIKQKGLV